MSLVINLRVSFQRGSAHDLRSASIGLVKDPFDKNSFIITGLASPLKSVWLNPIRRKTEQNN